MPEEVIEFYTSIFIDSRIIQSCRFGEGDLGKAKKVFDIMMKKTKLEKDVLRSAGK
jgi:predicted 3-demethylubiquinone-9 3-methyltransferase (glyoxalase superfamily)